MEHTALPLKLQERLPHIKLFVMDVDGTLTDGSMYYSDSGENMKRFYVRDGMGVARLPGFGIQTCLLTSEKTPIIQTRAERLKITHCIQGSRAKKSDLRELARRLDIDLLHVAYIGDDINDDLAMSISGVSFCPSDAHPIILQRADYVVPYPGGRGAVRAVCDMILEAQGHPLSLQDHW